MTKTDDTRLGSGTFSVCRGEVMEEEEKDDDRRLSVGPLRKNDKKCVKRFEVLCRTLRHDRL